MTTTDRRPPQAAEARPRIAGVLVAVLVLGCMALGAAMLQPAYRAAPNVLVWRGNEAATFMLSPAPLNDLYPWLPHTDRRLVWLAWVTVVCKLVAQFLFPVVLASRVAGRLAEAEARGGGAGARPEVVRGALRGVWLPWCIATAGVVLVASVANLALIQMGKAPTFAGFNRTVTLPQDLAMALPAVVVLPLSGLAIAVASAAAGAATKHPVPAVLSALLLCVVLDSVIGMAVPQLMSSVNEFITPPGLVRWTVPATLVVWLLYALAAGIVALLLWYFAASANRFGRSRTGTRA